MPDRHFPTQSDIDVTQLYLLRGQIHRGRSVGKWSRVLGFQPGGPENEGGL